MWLLTALLKNSSCVCSSKRRNTYNVWLYDTFRKYFQFERWSVEVMPQMHGINIENPVAYFKTLSKVNVLKVIHYMATNSWTFIAKQKTHYIFSSKSFHKCLLYIGIYLKTAISISRINDFPEYVIYFRASHIILLTQYVPLNPALKKIRIMFF